MMLMIVLMMMMMFMVMLMMVMNSISDGSGYDDDNIWDQEHQWSFMSGALLVNPTDFSMVMFMLVMMVITMMIVNNDDGHC